MYDHLKIQRARSSEEIFKDLTLAYSNKDNIALSRYCYEVDLALQIAFSNKNVTAFCNLIQGIVNAVLKAHTERRDSDYIKALEIHASNIPLLKTILFDKNESLLSWYISNRSARGADARLAS